MRGFLIITTITSFVFFVGGVRGYSLITTTITSFVSSGVACAVIFNYHYDYEFCFYRAACAVIF